MQYDILVVILAGGEGSRLKPLTDYRAKPAVPIGGKYRLIDIPLSNAANSGLKKTIVLSQGKDASLIRHLKDVWYSDSRFGIFVDIISPQIIGEKYRGDADAVRQIIGTIESLKPDFVLIVPGDHLLKMDYLSFIDFLSNSNAGVAISIKPEELKLSKHLGSVEINDRNEIISFEEKTPDPSFKFIDEDGVEVFYASMGIYAFRRSVLIKSLKNEGNLFGKEIIPKLLSHTKIIGYDYKKNNIIMDNMKVNIEGHIVESKEKSSDSDYWKDVGSINEYFKANMDLISISPRFNLYGEKWPFYTQNFNLGPGKIIKPVGNGYIDKVLLSEGSFISDSHASETIISPKVVIDKSNISETIVFNNSIVHECKIRRTIIDKGVVLKNMRIGYDEEEDINNGIFIDHDSKIRIVRSHYDFAERFFKNK